MMSRFSDRLTELRKSSGMTQDEFSRRIGMPRSTYGMYECGKRVPDIDTLGLFADYFNVDMDYLLGNTDKTTMLIERHEIPLTDTERRLLDLFRQMPESGQYEIIGYARRTLEEYRKEKESPSATA